MCRTCGLRPSASAARCSTPKRCCSSTTATARSRKATSCWISACVPTAICDVARGDQLADVRVLLRAAARSSAARRARRARVQIPSTVRKCCSASVSVGAISAPCRPASTARSSAYERDGRLARADVALEQPLHRRRARQVAVDLGDRPLLRVGERERQHLAVAVERAHRPVAAPRRRAPPARQSGGRARAGATSSSSKASRRRPTSASSSERGRCIATSASARSGSRSRRRRAARAAGRRRRGRASSAAATSARSCFWASSSLAG